MATALELAADRKHVELDEKHTHVTGTGSSISTADHGGTPTLADYVHQAKICREREDKLAQAASGAAGDATTDSDRTSPDKPDIEDELITARRALRNASWAAIFYLITTDILGPFNAPFAFSQVGYVPGAILYIVMGGVACYTGLILWRLFCMLDSDAYPVKTYSDIAERVIGKWFKHMCSALQSLQLIINVGTICLGNAQSVEQIARNNQFCFSVAILIWAFVGMVIGQVRSLKQYGWLANSAVWLNLLVIFITMGVVSHSPPNFISAQHAFGISPSPIQHSAFVEGPLFSKVNGIMQMVFAYGGAMIFPEFMAEMRRPMDFWKAMCCAQLLIATAYMLFGVFVYSFQGQFTLPLAFQGLSEFAWQTVGNVIALVTGIIAAGLYGNIGIKVAYYHIVEQWFNGPPLMSKKGRIVWTFMVILYWSLAFLVGSAIPQVQTISGLVAAVCIMQFTYTFPPLFFTVFWMRMDAMRDDPGDTWLEVSRWRRGLFGSGSGGSVRGLGLGLVGSSDEGEGEKVNSNSTSPSLPGASSSESNSSKSSESSNSHEGTKPLTSTSSPPTTSQSPPTTSPQTLLNNPSLLHNPSQNTSPPTLLNNPTRIQRKMTLYKILNILLFLGSLSMACLGMYGSGKSIKETFESGGAATSFGCGAPV